MKDAGSPPQAPDPNTVIPLQTAANKDMFNYALDASRVNQTSPYGTQSWSKTPTFDQAGYDKAMADWNAKYGAGASGASAAGASAGLSPSYFMQGGGGFGADGNPNGGNYNPNATVPSGSSNPAAPTKDQFTTNSWTYNQAFSPEQQKLYDQNVASQMQQGDLLKGLGDNVASAVSKPMDWSSLPQLTGSLDTSKYGLDKLLTGLGSSDPAAFDKTIADATYGQATRYLDPQQQQQRQQLEARLAEQGFTPGTPGYDQAMQNFMDTNNRAYGQARDSAITSGYQQANTVSQLQQQIARLLSGQVQYEGTFGNQARSQAMAEMLQQRNQPLNELNAMRTGTQVSLPNNPAQYGTPNLQTPDIMGAYQNQYMGNLGAYNADVASQNSGMGDMLGLLGAFGGAPSGSLFAGLGAKLLGGK